jgi:hypothetical protein
VAGLENLAASRLLRRAFGRASLPAEPLESTEYGTKYAIIAPLTGLNGRMAEIVTVWIILVGEDVPRFVTAYPKD